MWLLDTISLFLNRHLIPKLKDNRGFVALSGDDGGDDGGSDDGGDDGGSDSGDMGGDDTSSPGTGDAWYNNLPDDLKNNPTVQKYGSQEDQIKGHLELQSAFGKDKIVKPRDENDKEGWDAFNKAMGVPGTSEGYKLADLEVPEHMKEVSATDKKMFAEIAKEANLTPKQAETVWNKYGEASIGAINKHQENVAAQLDASENALRKEWGEAYDTKVNIGSEVVKKFAPDDATFQQIQETLGRTPGGMQFLAKIGEQFSENQVGDFTGKSYTMTPTEARIKLDEIKAKPEYLTGIDSNGRTLAPREYEALKEEANRLMAVSMKG